ncbi:glutathione S-transferase C-terminal-like protein [Fomitopsis schrenkii]|uniref:Glutathione S-transferase C-terminal-like protein n=1 Tax=Fomitopsis schrenkii TaxID=2126942 RepID=S8EQR0_FOMSC|nr:glutathione S-transferase C-terminal-like protein [Fomitopsis schrenkii]
MSPAPLVELRDIELYYFPICGRGEPIRLILEDTGVKYTEVNDIAAFREKQSDVNEFRFNQIPRFKVNGLNLAQTDAILRFIAKARGLGGNGKLEEDVIADMLSCACEDLHVTYMSNVYSPDAAKLLPPFAKNHVPMVLKQLEHLLKQSKSPEGYFVYEHPSFSEYHLYYLIYALGHLNPNLLSNFPELAAWKETMGARPGIKAYEESGRRNERLNGSLSAQKPVV